MLCPKPLVLRSVLGTAGRPQKTVTRWHKEEPVWSGSPRSLGDNFDRMSEVDQITLIGVFSVLLACAGYVILFVYVSPRLISSVSDILKSEGLFCKQCTCSL